MTYNQTVMEMEERGISKGREKGIIEGKIEGKIESIKNLMKNMKLPAEKAMEMLGIAKEDYSKYITML